MGTHFLKRNVLYYAPNLHYVNPLLFHRVLRTRIVAVPCADVRFPPNFWIIRNW